MLTANSRALHRVSPALLDERIDDKRDADTLVLRDQHDSEPAALDFPTVRRYPRTTGEAFRDAEYATALDGFPAEQPDPFASFEDFLDWIDARWRTWFATAIAIGAALAVFTLFFAKGGTPQ